MTAFEKAMFRQCFDTIHGALGMLRDAMKECGNPDAVETARHLEDEHLYDVRKLREKYDIHYGEEKK